MITLKVQKNPCHWIIIRKMIPTIVPDSIVVLFTYLRVCLQNSAIEYEENV